ncbi:hypothetical protein FJQ87_16950 [Shewanella sp. SNU WT4]|uniref:hypothetical protein n=1 Tax=Shewanella sp. SNU WT4 TaxID=2590015 RepID=UPI00112D96D6|nr:hypothetical protein [Shewanella sp. SNU WT4]QDF68128.1 hypothetical protein FJQ87_16950 [Shewanella sp. SNU WT4]
MKLSNLVTAIMCSSVLYGCGGSSASNDDSNTSGGAFYNKDTVLTELPEVATDSLSFARETSDSYNLESSKGKDNGSTKKEDLITWYNAIRHSP